MLLCQKLDDVHSILLRPNNQAVAESTVVNVWSDVAAQVSRQRVDDVISVF